ncbi:hypothetical protein [Mesorhizobium sp. M0199]
MSIQFNFLRDGEIVVLSPLRRSKPRQGSQNANAKLMLAGQTTETAQ